jgi:hypothetical protein
VWFDAPTHVRAAAELASVAGAFLAGGGSLAGGLLLRDSLPSRIFAACLSFALGLCVYVAITSALLAFL